MFRKMDYKGKNYCRLFALYSHAVLESRKEAVPQACGLRNSLYGRQVVFIFRNGAEIGYYCVWNLVKS